MKALLLVGLISLLLAACSSVPSPTPAPTKAVLASSTATNTPRPTRTPSPTATLTRTRTGTPTPRPTLPLTEVWGRASEFLNARTECKFPCWWGITPGQTSLQQVKDMAANFDTNFYIVGTEKSTLVEIAFPFLHNDIREMHQRFIVRNGVVDIIKTYDIDDAITSRYKLGSLMAEYGPPEEVWINTFPIFPSGNLPFSLFLVYSQQGMLASYGTYADRDGEFLEGCFEYNAGFELWPPEGLLSFHEANRRVGGYPIADTLLPIDEAVGLSLDEFYNKYEGTEGTVCLRTLKKLWSAP